MRKQPVVFEAMKSRIKDSKEPSVRGFEYLLRDEPGHGAKLSIGMGHEVYGELDPIVAEGERRRC